MFFFAVVCLTIPASVESAQVVAGDSGVVSSTSKSPESAVVAVALAPEKSDPWYRKSDWLGAVSTAIQAVVSFLALAGAAVAVVYARRSWLASEHTLAASVRPILGIELVSLDTNVGNLQVKLKNVGNGVANGVYFWTDESLSAESWWSWSRWPYNDETGEDIPIQIHEILEVKEEIPFEVKYPANCERIAFLFCAFDTIGNAIQTKAWIVDRDNGSSYIQSNINTCTVAQVIRFYDWKTLKNSGVFAYIKRIWTRISSSGY